MYEVWQVWWNGSRELMGTWDSHSCAVIHRGNFNSLFSCGVIVRR
jgi:hypothetical protein